LLFGDASVAILYSFDDGGLAQTTGTVSVSAPWTGSVLADPADAGLSTSFSVEGNPTVGDTCPGSLEITVPFTTVGQGVRASVTYPMPIPVTATAVHFALKWVIANDLDGSAAFYDELLLVNGAYSFLQTYAQWQYPLPDGGAPIQAFPPVPGASNDFVNVTNGYGGFPGGFPSDGDWLLQTVPLTTPDGGAVTTPTLFYLNELGVQLFGPGISDAGPAPLAFPIDLQFFVDDVYVQ